MDLGDSPRSDFLGFELLLEDEDRARLPRVREHMEKHVEPVINDYRTINTLIVGRAITGESAFV